MRMSAEHFIPALVEYQIQYPNLHGEEPVIASIPEDEIIPHSSTLLI